MRVIQLGKNIFEIRLPFSFGKVKTHLVAGLLEIQDGYSKEIICIQKIVGAFVDSYLVVTRGGKSGKS